MDAVFTGHPCGGACAHACIVTDSVPCAQGHQGPSSPTGTSPLRAAAETVNLFVLRRLGRQRPTAVGCFVGPESKTAVTIASFHSWF
jgi:hypothetical protein